MEQRVQRTSEALERTDYDLFRPYHRSWIMESSERVAMMALLQWLKPSCSIEIGTREGGSLSIIADLSSKVFTLDIDPNCINGASRFPNAEFIAGDSHRSLPDVLRTIEDRGLKLEFVLIDGEHAEDGVRGDIERILRYRPTAPCYILMHDSFNPFCREGMLSAAWDRCPYVHSVDIDFVPGKLYPPGETCYGMQVGGQMWGGLGLAVMRPEPRVGPLKILAGSQHLFEIALRHSVHRRVVLAKRLLGPEIYRRMKQTLGQRRFAQIGRLIVGR